MLHSVSVEWWKENWSREALDLGEDFSLPNRREASKRDVSLVVKLLSLSRRDRVLDLCCGLGFHALALAAQGYTVYGYDLSLDSLSHEEAAPQAKKTSFPCICGDMRHLPFRRAFDAVYMLFNSFGYFEDERDNRRVLGEVSRALKKGGRFLLDIPDIVVLRRLAENFPAAGGRTWLESRGKFLLREVRYDTRKKRWNVREVIIARDEQKEYIFSSRLYMMREIAGEMRASGLRIIRSMRVGERRLIVAQKS